MTMFGSATQAYSATWAYDLADCATTHCEEAMDIGDQSQPQHSGPTESSEEENNAGKGQSVDSHKRDISEKV